MHFYHTKRVRAAAFFFLVLMCTEICLPTLTYAISSGPSQSEFNGFTSAETTHMVDLATGDFKYDIPLLTVPGPGGGYPLVLSYNSGVGMNDEASWVGLGWSLNPGVVNRQMRGIPDDFSGENSQDKIEKVNYLKNNRTIGLTVSSDLMGLIPEVYGFDLGMLAPTISLPASYTIYSNTYSGLGTRVGLGAVLKNEIAMLSTTASFNLTMDSNEGAEVQGSLSASAVVANYNLGFKADARNGITSVTKSASYSLPGIPKPFYRAGGTFATSSHVPEISIPMKGVNMALSVDIEAGAAGTHMNIPITVEGSYSNMWVAHPERTFKAYGYLNGHRRKNAVTEDVLMDYNRENDVPVNLKLPSLPMPVATPDIYTVKGVGGGGIFRAFRRDAGIYYAPAGYTRSGGADVGLEAAASTGFKIAADISGFYASSYSGKWRGDYGNLQSKMDFKDPAALGSNEVRGMQPFYFRMLGESTPFGNRALYESFGGSDPSFIGINNTNSLNEELDPNDMPDYDGKYPFSGLQKFKTGILNEMNGQPIPNYLKTTREKQAVLPMYRTAKEIRNDGGEFFKSNNVTPPANSNPLNRTFTAFDFSTAAAPHIGDTHIGEFHILQTDGSTYHYGIPAYNKVQEEALFSYVDAAVTGSTDITSSAIVNYSGAMYQYGTNTSRDEFVSINRMSPYSHAHLLTDITSDDYVDVDNNGPSENDFGSYTKFNYKLHAPNFKWRIPYTTATNTAVALKGFTSVSYDNKAAFTYGEKELWYMQSVETKTHIAFFMTSNRLDGNPAAGKNGGRDNDANGKKLQKLDKIVLYSKKELEANPSNPKPLQTIEFGYAYDLCPGTPSNPGPGTAGGTHPNPSVGGDANAKGGKLTLVKVTIQYEQSNKGSLTPYVFDYGNLSDGNNNPAYHFSNSDRWGAYRPDGETVNGLALKNDIDPYTRQDRDHKNMLDLRAGAWNLKKIFTPSGGTVAVEYETDDYAYVQDREATQMMQIVGTAHTDGSQAKLAADGVTEFPVTQEYRRIYFKPEAPLSGSAAQKNAEVLRYLSGFRDNKIYFKLYEKLRRPKGETGWVSDYVTGYAEIDPSDYGYTTRLGTDIPYFTVKTVPQKGKHPFRVAGLQYMRYHRSDLARTAPGSAANAAGVILGALPALVSSMELIFGFYKWSILNGHCEYLDSRMPSFVKLHSPDGIKFGGGHRVRKIRVEDGWDAMTGNTQPGAAYEQNYVYKLYDRDHPGKSSGVASYEPQTGGDENAVKQPMFYDPDNKYITNDKAFFLETPIAEAYYPAPQVVYSRVLVYSTATNDVKASGNGITVYEHYTAKDYPVKGLTHKPYTQEDNQTAFIPFIAGIQFRNLGYSQGYTVEVNDMHGKLKGTYTYDTDLWDRSRKELSDPQAYKTYKKYIYNQNVSADPDELPTTRWDEDFGTLAEDVPRTATEKLGMDFEMFSELNESSGFSFSGGAQINGGLDVAPWMVFIAAMPYFEYAETGARTVVTTKVVYHTGILTEVVSYSEGSVERTKHIAFDSETGEPVLTVTTSDYDKQMTGEYEKPTYSYDMPAHWYYRGMGGAYANYRVEARLALTSGTATVADAARYFTPGDEVFCPSCPAGGKKLWVNALSGNQVTLVKRDGSSTGLTGTYEVTVLRSGKRNLQDAGAAHIVSTRPPNGPGTNPILAYFNDHAGTINGAIQYPQAGEPPLRDCNDPSITYSGRMDLFHDDGHYVTITISGCQKSVQIPVGATSYAELRNYRFYAGTTPQNVYIGVNGAVPYLMEMRGSFASCGVYPCMEGILDASAVEYQSEYAYDASDLAPPAGTQGFPSGNRGIYRVARSNAYFAARRQSKDATGTSPLLYPTFTGEDGTFDRFIKFNFDVSNGTNLQKPQGWRWASQVPERGYTRDGLVLQTVNPLGILSANLYGYDRHLVTASAVNASHREIGADGFEEHPLAAYSAANATGRLPFQNTVTGMTLTVSDNKSHTGNRSLRLEKPGGTALLSLSLNLPVTAAIDYTAADKTMQLQAGKKYVLSFWLNEATTEDLSTFVFLNGVNAPELEFKRALLDGWRRFELIFTAPASGTLPININHASREVYIDDIRIHPFNAEMKTMVYDPQKYLPLAELDGRNYATFYRYDEEGKPTVVKKETENGIYTISHGRQNTKK